MKKFKKIVVFGGAACSLALLLFFSVALVASAQGYIPLAPIEGTLKAGSNTTDLPTYLAGIYKVAIAAAGALAFLMIVWGGFTYVTAESIGGKDAGREYIQNAIGGLVLAIASYVLLYTINPALVQFNLDFGKLAAPSNINADWGYYSAVNSIVSDLRAQETVIAGTMLQHAGYQGNQIQKFVENKNGERGSEIARLQGIINDTSATAENKAKAVRQKEMIDALEHPEQLLSKINGLVGQITNETDLVKRAALQQQLQPQIDDLRVFNRQIAIANTSGVVLKNYLLEEGKGTYGSNGNRIGTMADAIAISRTGLTEMLAGAETEAKELDKTNPDLAAQVRQQAVTAKRGIEEQIAYRSVCPENIVYRNRVTGSLNFPRNASGLTSAEPCTINNHP